MAIREQTELNKINILKKETLASLDLSQHVGEFFGTTNEPEYLIDAELSDTSENPVQNKIIKQAFDNKADIDMQAIEFAESERQKSKNLINLAKIDRIVNATASYDGTTLTVNSNDGNTAWAGFKIKVKPNTKYTISGTIHTARYPRVAIYNTDLSTWYMDTGTLPYVWTAPDSDRTEYLVLFYSQSTSTYSNIQIEEGEVATDYQAYNGATLHEKDAIGVEHYEDLYNMASDDPNINLGQKGGILFKGSTTSATLIKSKTKYHHLRITLRLNNDDRKLCYIVENNNEMQTRALFTGEADWGGTWIFHGAVVISKNGDIQGWCNAKYLKDTTTTDSYNNNSDYYISKIEGVY